jgi:amino acid permease
LAGFGIFGTAVEGNILKNYGKNGTTLPILVALFGMAFAITLTYPLVFNSGRSSFYGLVPLLEKARQSSPGTVHYVLTTALVLLISLGACFVKDVQIVVGLTGALLGQALCFIIPALAYLKIAFSETRTLNNPGVRSKPMIAFALLLLIWGSISEVIGTLVVLGILV